MIDKVTPKMSAWFLFTLPVGIGLRHVLVINASKSDSYHMFSAPAAPAPIDTNRIPIIASLVEIIPGEVNSPTAQVKITKDITLGFINLNNSERLNRSSWLKDFFFNLELLLICFKFQIFLAVRLLSILIILKLW